MPLPGRGTALSARTQGSGPPVVLIHGGGEDAGMLAAQADRLAAAGHHVVTYDRRGTGLSGKEDWPGTGAPQHADDAAALITGMSLERPTVLGVSSGGVVALALAVRHPELVGRVVVWEPPAVGSLPGGTLVHAILMAPVRRHLRRHPEDDVGAQAILLSQILGTRVTVDDPAFARARRNARPMVRDEPRITCFRLRKRDLAGIDLTVGMGHEPLLPLWWAAQRLVRWSGGRGPVLIEAGHEDHLTESDVLLRLLALA